MPELIHGHVGRAKKRAPRSRVGLALAGGGPLGGIYEVGALIALADSLDGIDFNDLDVYVGVSSGGFVAAALANGISPAQMYRLFIDDGAEAALSPSLFLRPAFGEFARRAISIPRLLARLTFDYLRHPFQRTLMEALAPLGRAVPTGLFDQRAHLVDSAERTAAGQSETDAGTGSALFRARDATVGHCPFRHESPCPAAA